MEISVGWMETSMKANLAQTISKGMEDTPGLTADSTKVYGKITKCMGKALLSGQTEENMKDST